MADSWLLLHAKHGEKPAHCFARATAGRRATRSGILRGSRMVPTCRLLVDTGTTSRGYEAGIEQAASEAFFLTTSKSVAEPGGSLSVSKDWKLCKREQIRSFEGFQRRRQRGRSA